MRQKFSLESAGKVLGISANAVRARAKKSPDIYKIERDNRGKIWVHLDPENLHGLKVTKAIVTGATLDDLKASIEVLKEQAEVVAAASTLRERVISLETELAVLKQVAQSQEVLLSDRAEQISDLRSRLDKEGDERRRLAAILTDQSAAKPGTARQADAARRRWWPW